jgi:hypothetical protein
MANWGLGYAHVQGPDGVDQVTETLKCGHCQRIYPKPLPGQPSGFCHTCFRPVCLPCGGSHRCEPFEQKLAQQESRQRFLRSCGL